jgi:epoxyqueuosine reductase
LQAYLSWTQDDFLRHTEGSAIRRIGFERWQRNVATVAGNALRMQEQPALREALHAWLDHPSDVVREHVRWALASSV